MPSAATKPYTFDEFTTDELRARLADTERSTHYRLGIAYAMQRAHLFRTEISRREETASDDLRIGLEDLIAEAVPTPDMVPLLVQPWQADAGLHDDTLRDGYLIEADADGDWWLVPPAMVTIVSVPGEAYLLEAATQVEARSEALSCMKRWGL